MYQIVDNLSHQAGAHALRAGRGLRVQRRHHHVPAVVRGQLRVRVARQLSGRHLQRVHADVRRPGRLADQSERRRVRAGRVERRRGPDAEPGPALRPAVPRQPIDTDTNNVSPRVGFAWSPSGVAQPDRSRQRRPLLRPRAAARRRQRHAVGRATRPISSNLHQPSVSSIIPTQDGAPVFPDILPGAIADDDAGQLHDDGHGTCRTRTRGRPASRWNARSAEGGRSASATSTCAASNLLMSVNQNVPTCVAAGTNNGCRPTPAYRNNNQYSSVARFDLSRAARLVRAAAVALGEPSSDATRCRSR